MSCFCPLFENGGENEHRPWIFGNQTLTIYRELVHLHYELNPYLLSGGAIGKAQNLSQIEPLGFDIGGVILTSFDYLLGLPRRGNIFVSPIVEAGIASKKVHFPEHGETWINFWTNASYSGGAEHTVQTPINVFTAFKRAGALFALSVDPSNAYSLHRNTLWSDAERAHCAAHKCLTLHAHGLRATDTANVHEWKGNGLRAVYAHNAAASTLEMRVTATHSVTLRILLRGVALSEKAHEVTLLGSKSSRAHYTNTKHFYSSENNELDLLIPKEDCESGFILKINGIKSLL